MGRMPILATASMSGFAGKQAIQVTPSAFRQRAIKSIPFILLPGALMERARLYQ